MAVNDKDQNQTTALGAAMQSAQASASGNKNAGNANTGTNTNSNNNTFDNMNQNSKPRGFSSLGADIDTGIPLSSTGEVLGKLQQAIQAIINSYSEGSALQTTLIPVDKNDGLFQVPVSYLIVATQLRSNPDAGVGYQALIIEGSIESIAVSEENIPGGGKVNVLRTAMDADQPSVRTTIDNIVKQRFNTSKTFGAIAMVVPKTVTDKLNDIGLVKGVASRAVYAAGATLQQVGGKLKPLNLRDFVGGGDSLQAKLSFDSRQVANLFNEPVLSDIKIDLISEPIEKNAIPGFGNSGSTHIATASAFLDVIYQPKVPNMTVAGMPSFAAPTADSYRKFIPRVVLTMLRAERLMTIGGQMLALASAIAIRGNYMWMGALLPNRHVAGNEIDLRDAGALNTEVNFLQDPNVTGPFLDIKADSFSTRDLMIYLKSIFHEGSPVFSVDVSLRGPDTWYNGVLAAADNGDPAAIKAVLNAINHMTNGEFAKLWKEGDAITMQKGENIYLGHYRNSAGVVCDLRTVDNYMAVANLVGRTNPDVLRDYSDTYLNLAYPEPQRMEARRNILKKLVPDAEITGTARRVSFTGKLIDTMVQALANAQINIPLTGNVNLDTGVGARAVGDFAAGMTGSNGNDVFSRGVNNNNQGSNFGGTNQYASAWGN